MPHDDRGRDWSDANANQGAPRIASQEQKLEEAGKDPTPVSEAELPADTLIFDF